MCKLSIISIYNTEPDRELYNLAKLYDNVAELTNEIIIFQEYHTLSLSQLYEKSVLIKPNWVRHNVKENDFLCLITHPNFILAVLDIILEYKPKEVIIADAPIQGCIWDKLLPKEFYEHIQNKEKRPEFQ